jgi:MFS family permease
MTGMSSALGQRFWLLCSSAIISNLGDGLRLTALPLLAYSISQAPLDIALVTALASAPWLLFGALMGAVADRIDRRKAIVFGNVVRGVLVGGLALLVAADQAQLWHIYVLAVSLPFFEMLVDNSAQPFLLSLVRSAQLEKANSRLFTGRIVAEDIVGAPIAAILFGVGASLPFFLNSATFWIAALLMLGIRGTYRAGEGKAAPVSRLPAEVMEGVRILLDRPMVRDITLVVAILDFALMAGTSLLIVFVKEDLGFTDAQFGLLFTIAAIGSILGGLAAPAVVARIGTGATLVTAVTMLGLSRLFFGFATQVWHAFAMFFVAGVAAFLWHVAATAYRQRATPSAALGRVVAASVSLSHGAALIGALVAAAVAELINVRATMVGGGIVVLACAVFSTRFLRHPREEVSDDSDAESQTTT